MINIPKSPFIVVDGSSYLFRAYHAMPPLTNSKGEPTGAIYGVINMLRKLLVDYSPKHIAVVFDTKGKNFRHEIYPEYKANREQMPDELAVQIEPLHEVIRAMGLPLVAIEGIEADDVIGTLAREAKKNGMFTLISTGDKDMAQLVDDKTVLVNTMSGTYMDIEGVKEKFEVSPERIIDYLSLIGDSVDNIPGVHKVGPKTAVKWLNEYGDLDTICQKADLIKGKVGENLRDALKWLPLTKELVTIKDDLDIDVHVSKLERQHANKQRLKELFSNLEFKTWLRNLEENLKDQEHGSERDVHLDLTNMSDEKDSGKVFGKKANETRKYFCINTKQEFEKLLEMLDESKLIAFDTETTSLNHVDAILVGLSFSIKEGEAYYIPVGHDYEGVMEQLDIKYVLSKLKPIFEDESKVKLAQNAKYDMSVLENYNIYVKGLKFDTLLESYVLNSTSTRHNLDNLAKTYLNHTMIGFEDVAGKGAKQITFDKVAIDVATDYAAEDADITLQLHNCLWPQLEKHKKQKEVFENIDIPLIEVLKTMEREGVLIDADELHSQSEKLASRISKLAKKAYEIAGCEFNISSPKQLQEILYEKLKLPQIKTTPKGQPSTAESVLQELSIDYELPKVILEYRSLAKLISTYTDKLPEQINKKTGRVHTSYHQAVTATGRLSSSDPNLQNIPIKTPEGRKVRKAFIAPKGYKLVSADYSQVELRIMAHISGDEGLLKAFERGLDIHSATAAEVFGVDIDKVTSEQRRHAKAINFGLIYGMSAYGLSLQLGVERSIAASYMDLYFKRYPKVKTYMEETKIFALEHGFVETYSGRRLYLPDIKSRNHAAKNAAQRAAINAPMQGTAADIIKIAMININKWIKENDKKVKMIMQVHDELVFEVRDDFINEAKSKIKYFMESAVSLKVPLLVAVGEGDDWEQAH